MTMSEKERLIAEILSILPAKIKTDAVAEAQQKLAGAMSNTAFLSILEEQDKAFNDLFELRERLYFPVLNWLEAQELQADFAKQRDSDYGEIVSKHLNLLGASISIDRELRTLKFMSHEFICRYGNELEKFNREVRELIDKYEMFEE